MTRDELFARTCEERNTFDARCQAIRIRLQMLSMQWDSMSRSPWIDESRQRVFAENARTLREVLDENYPAWENDK